MNAVTLDPIMVNTGSADENGALALVDGKLVAVLVELAAEEHGDHRGLWFVEAGFGPCKVATEMTFSTCDEALQWLVRLV